jgi:hypothetical protein
MLLPTIHMNGTAASDLLEGYIECGHALRQAIKDLENHGAPNGRDYYPQGPDAIQTAQREHAARIAKVAEVLHDIEALAEHAAEAELINQERKHRV